MGSNNFVDFIERFYYDILGYLIPGFLFLLSLIGFYCIFFNDLRFLLYYNSFSGFLVIITLSFSYIFGHFLAQLTEQIFIGNFFWRNSWKTLFKDEKQKKNGYFDYKKEIQKERNCSLNNISSDDKQLIYKFMFTSHFNLGVAFVFILFDIGCIYTILHELYLYRVFSKNSCLLLILGIIIAIFLYIRGREFYRRAIELPITMSRKSQE